jgi:hypothetical protein
MILGCEIFTIKQIMADKIRNIPCALGKLHGILFKNFLKQYENTILTQEIFDNEIKNHKYYSFECLYDYDYECPGCEVVNSFEDTSICDMCDALICDENCFITELYDNGINYCQNCYIERITKFSNKYKDVIITANMVREEDFTLGLNEIDDLMGTFHYKCPNCDDIIIFDSDIMKCDYCDNYICWTCGTETYERCAYESCTNTHRVTRCNICFPTEELKIKQPKRSISPCVLTDDVDKQCNVCLTNVKKYACVPCGHMCVCGECSNKIGDKCPICNDKITSIIRIF